MTKPTRGVIGSFAQFFRPGFVGWLGENFHVFESFEAAAFRLLDDGHDHLSARTIVHGMRHFTPCRETSLLGFKINDHLSPDLARVFSIKYPSHAMRFESRRSDRFAFLAALGVCHA